MRLWSLHPRYLDRQGLTAAWREALLAQAVLLGRTRGYRAHPQLLRFLAGRLPRRLIARYLRGLHQEATRRGYRFDATRIADSPGRGGLTVARGQLDFEWTHLRAKLARRSPTVLDRWRAVTMPRPHPMFRVVAGGIADWERGAPA